MDLKDVRARTLAGQPVRGIAEVAREIHVHRGNASDAVAQLDRDKLIANEPEQVGHSPKLRLWALTAPGFAPPPRPRGAR
jgi:hypothetical protein